MTYNDVIILSLFFFHLKSNIYFSVGKFVHVGMQKIKYVNYIFINEIRNKFYIKYKTNEYKTLF